MERVGHRLEVLNAGVRVLRGALFYSTQKFYEQADYFCSIGFPYQGKPLEENEAFMNTMNMMADYCSSKGNVLGKLDRHAVRIRKGNR